VIATTQPWPEVRACLDSLHNQAQAAGAEVILADGCGQGLTEEAASSYPEVIWLKAPGASVFYLRALAMSRARGEIIAVTEDHCRVKPDWCERVIAAHKQYPEAAAIGGAVENGATERLMDWASFFIVNGPSMPPIRKGERSRIALQANVSYKRRIVPPRIPQHGRMEWMFNQALRAQGETLVADGRIMVSHVQSLGFRGTCRIHFDDGRSIAGFRLQQITALERGMRLGACFVMPPLLLLRTLIPVLQKRRVLGRVLASLPLLALLLCCRATGAFIGFLAGPGDSPQRIR
jgi:hypothetical protein